MTEALETLWITDAELIRRCGVPDKIMRRVLKAFDQDRRSGFPRKDPLHGDRRYWPAVKAYYDRKEGLRMASAERRMA